MLEEPEEGSTNYDNIQLTTARPPCKKDGAESLSRCLSPWESSVSRNSEEDDEIKLGILKQFTFSSELQVHALHVHVHNTCTCTCTCTTIAA